MTSAVRRPLNIGLCLTGLCVLGLILRLPTLFMGIWLDEFLTINSSTAPDFVSLITTMYGRLDDLHPPLHNIFVWIVIKLFGNGDVVVRIPTLIFGILQIPAMYWLGKTVHSRTVGLIAAFFAVISPFANFFSCQCRGYMLATLLTTLTIGFFCKLLSSDDRNWKKTFCLAVISATGVCYTEYVSCLLLPLLGAGVLLVTIRDYLEPTKKQFAIRQFLRCIGALTATTILFAPWIPSILMQKDYGDVFQKPMLSQWPQVFLNNLANQIPLPMLLSFALGIAYIFPFIFLLFLLRKWKWKNIPASYLVLFCITFLPSLVMGYITTWWVGYYRYIFPFSPAMWVLLAIFLAEGCGYLRNTDTGETAEHATTADPAVSEPGKKHNVILIATLVILFVLNGLQVWYYDSKGPQSGLRTFAREIREDKYQNSLILAAPDVLSMSFGYYLPKEEREKHKVIIRGFTRWEDPFTPPNMYSMPAQWQPTSVVEECEKRIDDEAKSAGWKYLAFVEANPDWIRSTTTKAMPRGIRIAALKQKLQSKYREVSKKFYPAALEDVTVTVYELR